MSVLVSIIVPCYNQAHFLKDSLQSVLDQNYEHWECIIVNDGSPDDTDLVVKKWLQKDPRFKYHQQKNKGLSAARNAGINNSTGTFILPLDADDILHTDFLKLTLPEMDDERIEIVSSHTDFFTGQTSNKVGGLKPTSGTVHNLLHVNQLVAASLYRKSSWKKAGGYDESMKNGFEDWEFWLRILKGGYQYTVVPRSLFYYRKAKESMLVHTIANHSIDVKKYIVHKHRDLYIKDFDNYVTVCAYDLKVVSYKLSKIENSTTYKIAQFCVKPLRMVQKLLNS